MLFPGKWLFCVALLALGLLVDPVFGVLGVFFVLLLAFDVAVPMHIHGTSEADSRFLRLARQRRLARLASVPSGRPLAVLDDEHGWAAHAQRRALGVQTIPIASITATVEPSRARSFDRRLRPARAMRQSWTRMFSAHGRGDAMPPIAVYRVGDRHVLRDGHRRASVARAAGCTEVDAEVVELFPPAGAPETAPNPQIGIAPR